MGAILAGLLVGTLMWAPRLWVFVLAASVPVATYEVTRQLRDAGYDIPLIPLLLGGQAMVWLSLVGPPGVLGAFGVTAVVCMVWQLIGGGLTRAPQNYLRDMSATLLIAIWVPLCMGFGALLTYPDPEIGAARVFCLLLPVVLSDIGGYTVGVLFGTHPMVPAISPKKTWEGFAGSVLFGVSGAVFAIAVLLHRPAWIGLPLGIFLVLTGVLGDLVESQVKRDLGIKDMGRLLPGHGGLMDRLDGLLPAAVVTWAVLTILT